MKLNMKYLRSSMVVIGIFVAFLIPMTAFAADPNPGVLPPQSHPYGKTYGEWSNAWWQWAFSIPVSENPLICSYLAGDPKCSAGQSGSVWFLGATAFEPGGTSTPVTRTCNIPAGKALFFPIVNAQQDNIGCPPPSPLYTEQQLRDQANSLIGGVDTNSLTAQIDGVNITNLASYRAGSTNPAYSFTLPSDNLYSFILGCTIQPGTYSPAISDGYYLMLAPLSAGSHTIKFTAAPFGIDVTYHLTVK